MKLYILCIKPLCLEKSDGAQFLKKSSPCMLCSCLLALFLESDGRGFLIFAWWWDIIAISEILNGIPPNIPLLGKWAIGPPFAQNYEILYLSIYSKYFFKNFAVWYRTIGKQKWFNHAQTSFNFSESTTSLVLFMWLLN